MMLRPKTWLAAARAAAGYSAPLLPFASFPAALSAEGQILRPAELPRVELIAIGGVWRPRGGRQVLASRFINPVTVQNTSGGVAETIGPFPGGLVRAGMRLEIDYQCGHSGISSSARYMTARIGTGATRNNWAEMAASNSGASLTARTKGVLSVLSDTNAAHRSGLANVTVHTVGAVRYDPTVDFSAAWSADIRLFSVAETAITITGATWSAGVATYTTSAPHTLAVADKTVVSGITPSGWNTTAIVSAVGSSTTFSVPMAVDPGAYTSGGSSARTSNMESQSWILTLEG